MATSRSPASKGRGFQCPICGAWEREGGCTEIKKCIAALIAAETECTRETVEALAREPRAQQARVLSAGLDALSQLQIALLLCDGVGRVIGANYVAERILERRDGLELNPDGILCATQEGEPAIAALVQEVAEAARTGRLPETATVVALGRGAGRRPLSTFLRPSHTALKKPKVTKGTVLVIVLDSELPVEVAVVELRQLYGFTSTEARLANLLMEGKALAACCDQLGIRRSTACTHLRRLFNKTGVHRQSELVALLLKSIGLARLACQTGKIGSADHDGHSVGSPNDIAAEAKAGNE